MRANRLYISIFIMAIVAIFATSLSLPPKEDPNKLVYVDYSELSKENQKQIDCLADNIYHEARSEEENGQIAVALVTLNRVQDPRYPKDICGVVKQKVKSTCQFSWFCLKRKTIPDRARDVYVRAREIAIHVYVNYEKLPDITGGALFYHADYVNPRWKLERTATIGRHIFYKERDGNAI